VEILLLPFVVYSKLFTGVDRVVRITAGVLGQLPPECGSAIVLAAALCEQRQIPPGLRAKFRGQAEIESLCAGIVRPIFLTAFVQEP
jgi:hypothetical protein